MKTIKLYDHPFSACAPQKMWANSIGEFLLEHYGDVPSVNVQVFKGEPCKENEITGDLEALLANDADEYVILQSPGAEPITAFEAIQALLAFYAIATALTATAPSRMPANVNRQQQSPNNALGNRENQLRIGQRVEDIYGKVRSTPTVMMQTYQKYIQNQKYEYGYYCVGRGYYEIDDVRDGDTLINDIDGASAAIYAPFTSPNSGDEPQLLIGDAIIDPVLSVIRSNSVDGITLKAPNEIALALPANYTFEKDPTGDIIRQAVDAVPNLVSIAQDGQTVTVDSFTYTMPTISGSFTFNGVSINDNSGTGMFANVFAGDTISIDAVSGAIGAGSWVVSSKTDNNIISLSGASFPFTDSLADIDKDPIDFGGSYIIDSVGDGFVKLTTATLTGSIPLITENVTVDTGLTGFTDWFTLSSKDRSEVWVNVIAQQGMYKDNGTKLTATVDYTIEIEKLNTDLTPAGIVETVTGSLSGSISDEVADTVEQATAWVGPARVRMKRTSNLDLAFTGTVVDEIKFGDLYSVAPVDKTDFGNKTTIHTVTKATARATAVKSRQLRCLASRKLPTFHGTTFSGAFNSEGLHVSGTISPTGKLVDIIAAVAIDPKIGRRQISEIDVAQMWSVQQQLDAWSTECGQYNYTLDSDNTSFEETVIGIANAGFCTAYRQNGKIRLSFEKVQTNSTALFTHRNKKPDSETITRSFANDAEYDGVEFVYVDPESEQSETIILPIDGNYTKLKKFEIAGIRSYTQAWYRANREYYKLTGQRITIETGTTLDARFALPSSRVDIVDNTRFKSFDGEVIGQSGLVLTLSQKVEFLPSTPHSILLMKRDGTLQSIAATPGNSSNKVVLATLPAEAIKTTHDKDGVRTIYSFAADSKRDAQAYLVQEIDITDGQYATIKAVNYSPDYYQMDYETVPDKAGVIN